MDAQAGLRSAQLGLARVDDAGQNFSLAEAEIVAVLKQSPGDLEATALLGKTYDEWSAAAAARGDWLTVAVIDVKRLVELPGGG